MFRSSILANVFKKSILFLGSTVPLMLLSRLALAEDSEDLLAGLMPSIASTFGHSSTVMKCLYIGEVVMAVVGFIKTKNPLIFLGIVVLSLFLNFVLRHLVGI